MKESAAFRVDPGQTLRLADHDADDIGDMTKSQARRELAQIKAHLNELQEKLYATETRALLVVLQGMDTSGKDGVIKHVIEAFNPQGCEVTSFKVPTAEELAHDFLWRVHRAVPRRGKVGIFNRSHYEDVLVVRVENLVPEAVWRKRYDAINQFEHLLTQNGVLLAKFFLHISREEQRERLRERQQQPHEQWKFRVDDLKARAKWDDYQAAYEEALSRCSTQEAPWYLVPANKKWYRNLVVSRILMSLLDELEMAWPPLEPEAKDVDIV